MESVSSATSGSGTHLISSLQRRVSVHSVLWHSSGHGNAHQQGQIRRPRRVDTHSIRGQVRVTSYYETLLNSGIQGH